MLTVEKRNMNYVLRDEIMDGSARQAKTWCFCRCNKVIVLVEVKCYNVVKKDCKIVTKMLIAEVYISEKNQGHISRGKEKGRRA